MFTWSPVSLTRTQNLGQILTCRCAVLTISLLYSEGRPQCPLGGFQATYWITPHGSFPVPVLLHMGQEILPALPRSSGLSHYICTQASGAGSCPHLSLFCCILTPSGARLVCRSILSPRLPVEEPAGGPQLHRRLGRGSHLRQALKLASSCLTCLPAPARPHWPGVSYSGVLCSCPLGGSAATLVLWAPGISSYKQAHIGMTHSNLHLSSVFRLLGTAWASGRSAPGWRT